MGTVPKIYRGRKLLPRILVNSLREKLVQLFEQYTDDEQREIFGLQHRQNCVGLSGMHRWRAITLKQGNVDSIEGYLQAAGIKPVVVYESCEDAYGFSPVTPEPYQNADYMVRQAGSIPSKALQVKIVYDGRRHTVLWPGGNMCFLESLERQGYFWKRIG